MSRACSFHTRQRPEVAQVRERSNLVVFVCLGLCLLFFFSCAAPKKTVSPSPGYASPYKIGRQWYYPLKETPEFRQQGIASWYGKEFHGRKTSSGDIYDMYAMTGAHKTLPLGTYVNVHNLTNGKVVNVRINDRGPFVRGRIIDLSYRAAKELGLVGPGTAPVEITALGTPKETRVNGGVRRTLVPGNYYAGNFAIQVGAFREKANALRLKNKLARTYKDAYIVVHEDGEGKLYRVRMAKCTTLDKARHHEKMLEADGYPDAFVVAR